MSEVLRFGFGCGSLMGARCARWKVKRVVQKGLVGVLSFDLLSYPTGSYIRRIMSISQCYSRLASRLTRVHLKMEILCWVVEAHSRLSASSSVGL